MSEYIVELNSKRSIALMLAIAEEARGGDDIRGEVVRCRDCKYLCDDGSTWGCGWHCSCLTTNDGTPPDGFCSWGERK